MPPLALIPAPDKITIGPFTRTFLWQQGREASGALRRRCSLSLALFKFFTGSCALPLLFKPCFNKNCFAKKSRRLTRSLIPALAALLSLGTPELQAQSYLIDPSNTDLVGEIKVIQARESDTLMDIARVHSLGYRAIRMANPDLDIWLPGESMPVVIPSRFVLPNAPREGIVLNRGEMRLYFFHEDPESDQPMVTTYPVGIGRADRQTPTGRGWITMKLHKPTWYPTENVRADYAAQGKTLARQIPAGPDNPLGEYALVLNLPGYLIHGTNKPDGIGMLVSQGCVRLYPEHIEALVAAVERGTPVTIIDQPSKAGIANGKLMVEVHPPVYPDQQSERGKDEQKLIEQIILLLETRGAELEGDIDWNKVTEVFRRADGIPVAVTRSVPVSAANSGGLSLGPPERTQR